MSATARAKVEIVNFGCRLNMVEGEAMRRAAEAAGRDNLVIVNTCAVTAEAARQARQTIRRLKRETPEREIVVTGCGAQTAPDTFAAMPEITQILGNAEKLEPGAFARGQNARLKLRDILAEPAAPPAAQGAVEGHTRAFLAVQTGCDHRCTFCIIPYGRGPSRSAPAQEIAAAAQDCVARGFREIVLTGVDLTSYGRDIDGRPGLGRLVKAILHAAPGLARLRLSSIDCIEADDDLRDALANEARLMPHLHLSLQAGSDMILKRMKRRHSRAAAVRFCAEMRAARPDIVFGADLIAGFPTETDEMFAETLALVEDCGLTHLHVFPFSPRPGTPAALMSQLPRTVVTGRAQRLCAAGATARAHHLAAQIGKTLDVLTERGGTGRAADFTQVRTGPLPAGQFVPVTIAGHDGKMLLAQPVSRSVRFHGPSAELPRRRDKRATAARAADVLKPSQIPEGGPMSDKLQPIARALISVSDKTGLVAFAQALAARHIEIVSTGGTHQALVGAGVAARDVSELTGFPEMMDGRVKTLHPKVHGGLLAIRENPEHEAAMLAHDIAPIDLLVVNLYPFEATVAKGADFDECIENIDIGGPAMIRAASKNFDAVSVIVDVADYARLLAELDAQGGKTRLSFRRALAQKAFARTAAYDAGISNWLAAAIGENAPDYRAFGGRKIADLRYGENPHQAAGFYAMPNVRFSLATAEQIQGKQLSYNNVGDTDAALELVSEFDPAKNAAVAIIKHANPCGVAQAATLAEAYRLALRCDPVSAFGGIIALNRTLDAETAQEIVKIFTEVIIAPEAEAEARALIAAKPNLRLLLTHGLPDPRRDELTFRSLNGGFLVQGRDKALVDDMDLKVVTKRAPGAAELADLKFAFRVAKHVKSNAIVYAKDGATVGIGAGQMSRVDSSRIAAQKALEAAQAADLPESLARGAVVASDAFFPFADGLLAAAAAGATAVIQPGGSLRDSDVIKAADEAGLAMVFTGTRHFRH